MRPLLLAVVMLVACTREAAHRRPPVPPGAIGICETCVGSVAGWSIGVSNIWARDLAGPSGVVKKQPAAQLSLWKEGMKDGPHLTVVVGSTFDLDGDTYEVIDIDDPKDQPGSITLRKVPKPDSAPQ